MFLREVGDSIVLRFGVWSCWRWLKFPIAPSITFMNIIAGFFNGEWTMAARCREFLGSDLISVVRRLQLLVGS